MQALVDRHVRHAEPQRTVNDGLPGVDIVLVLLTGTGELLAVGYKSVILACVGKQFLDHGSECHD